MNFLTIGIKVLQLIGLACSIIAAYWIPKGDYNNFIRLYPAGARNVPYRGGVFRQENGIITIPNYENIERIDQMLKKGKLGYKLLAAGFIIQFIAFAIESISMALDP
jgi:hypothetical protein